MEKATVAQTNSQRQDKRDKTESGFITIRVSFFQVEITNDTGSNKPFRKDHLADPFHAVSSDFLVLRLHAGALSNKLTVVSFLSWMSLTVMDHANPVKLSIPEV